LLLLLLLLLLQANGAAGGGGGRGQRPAPELEDKGVVGEQAMGKGGRRSVGVSGFGV
jgi:hypothetical protein